MEKLDLNFIGYKPICQLRWDDVCSCQEDAKKIAKDQVWRGILAALHTEGIRDDDIVWLGAYDEVADWLANNQNKGLFLSGDPGTGKTVLANFVLRPILEYLLQASGYGRQTTIDCMTARQMAQYMKDDVQWIFRDTGAIIIDDVGTESTTFNFGEQINAFFELVDFAEREGKLLVLTSNLTKQEIIEKYGERTFDRLRKLCRLVVIKNEGRSLRK